MSILHTVNKSPFEKSSLQSCLKYLRAGSGLLLIEDGVYGALRGTEVEMYIQRALEGAKVYALGPDLKARGFLEASLLEGVEVVDYEGFVELSIAYDKVQAWL